MLLKALTSTETLSKKRNETDERVKLFATFHYREQCKINQCKFWLTNSESEDSSPKLCQTNSWIKVQKMTSNISEFKYAFQLCPLCSACSINAQLAAHCCGTIEIVLAFFLYSFLSDSLLVAWTDKEWQQWRMLLTIWAVTLNKSSCIIKYTLVHTYGCSKNSYT